MFSDAASYVTDRITETAAERLGPKIAWGAAIATLVLAAIAFGLVALYAFIAPLYGPAEAAALIGGGSLALALLLAFVAWGYGRWRRNSKITAQENGQPFAAIDEEAREAIDYFGSARVIATAFMFGFTAARKVKS